MTTILQEPWDGGLSILFRLEQVLLQVQTPHQQLLIAQSETYGRSLFLDDLVQSTQADEALYHEPFVHPALTIHGHPRRVLIGGAGEGATLREVLRHKSVEEVVCVDLDPAVVNACKQWLPTWHQGAFDDARVTLRFEDVRHTLATQTEPFDAILLDITDPVEGGPSVELFTTRFYRQVAAALQDDGIVVLQAGEIDPTSFGPSCTVRSTLASVFPWTRWMHLHVPSFHGIWGLLLAGKRPLDAIPGDLEARISRLPTEVLQVYTPIAHQALLELPPMLARGLAQPGTVISGDDDARHIIYRARP